MKRIVFFTMLIALVSCSKKAETLILISSNAEWKALAKIIKPADNIYHNSPYGYWFNHIVNSKKVIFFHGGWGKIDAAGSTQYVINEFNPKLIINLGTAGGFSGKAAKGDLILINKTVTYDIYERMGDSKEAIDYYSTILNYPKIPSQKNLRISPIVSADQDLFPKNIEMLNKKYGAIAGDWESSAIAHVAKKNKVECYIIRGISDIVYPSGSETYGNINNFEKESENVMRELIKLLEKIL